ncbi:hypothetical protein ZWY2020_044633 [Hordeum vulgare]|nr:hypothetical protein ZWY2020_044633 [Hordeum vulgare]
MDGRRSHGLEEIRRGGDDWLKGMRPSSHTTACHLATDAGKEIANKVGFVYQLNISPKKMGVDEEIFVVDLKKGAVSTALERVHGFQLGDSRNEWTASPPIWRRLWLCFSFHSISVLECLEFSAMVATGDVKLCLQGLITVVDCLNGIRNSFYHVRYSDKLINCSMLVIKIINLATLTGACVVALGPSIAGIFTPSDELAQEVTVATELSGEKFSRLPMEESYWEQMKSGVADMVNTGGR